jgi:hypothetical protein
MKRKCEKVMKIDYGLKILPYTVLRIANTEEFHWLLQPELKAQKDYLKYVEEKDYGGDTYRGYVNWKGEREGVGILMGHWKEVGEWYKDKLHGTAKIEFHSGSRYWGQYKNG